MTGVDAAAERRDPMPSSVGRMEREMDRLEALYRPVATRRLEAGDTADLAARVVTELAALHVGDRAQTLLRDIVARYGVGPEAVRVRLRALVAAHPSFRWAAGLPRDWGTAAGLRDRLLLVSLRDQGADPRDEILEIRALCDRAVELGIDPDPVLTEVAGSSSVVDRYGMGSLRDILLSARGRRSAAS